MKINNKDIKELYRSYLEEKLPVSRTQCPSPQDITACLRGESSRKRRYQIIDHVLQCSYCHKEYEFALETIREERKFIHELGSIIQENRNKKEKKLIYLFTFRPSWLYTLILIAGVVLITLLVKNITEEHKYRGSEAPSIILINPNKKTNQKAQLKFEWEDIRISDYYIIEIFDESLYPIWTSEKITTNNTLLSEEITNKFLKNKTYFWMVTAFLSDGKKIESQLQEFMISD
jgi:hypothetical protein